MTAERGHVQTGWRGFAELVDPADLAAGVATVARNVLLASGALEPRAGLERVDLRADAVTGLWGDPSSGSGVLRVLAGTGVRVWMVTA